MNYQTLLKNINNKQLIILLVFLVVILIILYSLFSRSEEEIFADTTAELITTSNECAEKPDKKDLNCEQLITTLMSQGKELERYYKSDKSWKSKLLKIYGNAGSLSRDLKNFEAARTAYEKLIYYDPQNAKNYGILADTLINLKQGKSALTYSRLAVQIEPDQWQAYDVHARALEANGDYEEALSGYQKAFELAPESRKKKFEDAINKLLDIIYAGQQG